jgi:Arc/MetJ-type ribon-helix-helix transcriptional regulator
METISKKLQDELRQRVSDGAYASLEALLRDALNALDHARSFREALEAELLEALDGDEIEMNEEEWAKLKSEGASIAIR